VNPAPDPIRRFSSRRGRLDKSFLNQRLQGAKSYDRIAGYFSSSILEVAGEALDSVSGKIRVVCNSELDPLDVQTARAAQSAMRRQWCASQPEALLSRGGDAARQRFGKLYEYLTSGKLEVRVLPDEHFGLIHGKAGVITAADGGKTSFIGSANESRSAWVMNYELVWEDGSPEAVSWVQEEFDALWSSPFSFPLANAVVEDIERLSRRKLVPTVRDWIGAADRTPDPAAVFIETSVYRKEVGLWEHQKYFVKLAFDAHCNDPGGARLVLADQVGLGKTVQLAMVAELAALTGQKPILVLAPKTLIWQWQGELKNLLDVPSAVWNGRQWVDENGIEHPAIGARGIAKCPRRIGIVSTGLVTAKSEAAGVLKALSFDCVILDEAHRARRTNLGQGRGDEAAVPNNLLAYVQELSGRTRSMLLATATPVQLYPIEAWDLLHALGAGSEAVLGNMFSRWRDAPRGIDLVMGDAPPIEDEAEMWEWVRNPMPPSSEHRDFEILRRSLDMRPEQPVAGGGEIDKLRPADRSRLRGLFPRFVTDHNPFIRRIVRRSREYLEKTIDRETGEPFLKPIHVRLSGEGDDEAIVLPPYLVEAYERAEEFCKKVSQRRPGSGLLRTLLLRRVGSTMYAGMVTAEKILNSWQLVEAEDDEDDDEQTGGSEDPPTATGKTLVSEEQALLEQFLQALQANQERDPKYAVVRRSLLDQGWLDRGCIIFSQYRDSIQWLAEQLSGELKGEPIAIYSGPQTSGVMRDGEFAPTTREDLKLMVTRGQIRLMLGTDAASEGLNLQRLGTLINLDLPWNPTRLEQRKGRIQRIGQVHETVDIYNMRYGGSVEDRVHHLLSTRLQAIHGLFGQLPDVLEDVWVEVALGNAEQAKKVIDAVPQKHPFEVRYKSVSRVPWEKCAEVLQSKAKLDVLKRGW